MNDSIKINLARLSQNFQLRKSVEENEKAQNYFNSGYELPTGYKRVYFHHIPKAAGSSLKRSFYSIDGDDHHVVSDGINTSPNRRYFTENKVYVRFNHPLIEEGNYFFACSHFPSHYVRLPENTFTITCFRDPLERIISLYGMNQRRWKRGGAGSIRHKINAQMSWLGPGAEQSGNLLSFAHSLKKRFLLNQLYMFSRKLNIDEAKNAINRVNHILFLDDYKTGIEELSKRLCIDLKASHSNKMEAAKPTFPQEQIDAVKLMLEPEYKFLDEIKESLTKIVKTI